MAFYDEQVSPLTCFSHLPRDHPYNGDSFSRLMFTYLRCGGFFPVRQSLSEETKIFPILLVVLCPLLFRLGKCRNAPSGVDPSKVELPPPRRFSVSRR